MLSYRTTPHPATAEAAFAAMERHHARQHPARDILPSLPPIPAPVACPGAEGDVIYGGRAIAQFVFGASDNRTRRRVFSLAQHYLGRKEKAGFFKLKGALCLSRSQWLTFHGLG